MTASALIGRWAVRDERYRRRKLMGVRQPLTEAEANRVRDWRRREVAALPLDDQPDARRRLTTWQPPVVIGQ